MVPATTIHPMFIITTVIHTIIGTRIHTVTGGIVITITGAPTITIPLIIPAIPLIIRENTDPDIHIITANIVRRIIRVHIKMRLSRPNSIQTLTATGANRKSAVVTIG